MALADYFQRDLVAASQVVAGFDRAAFEAKLGRIRVGVAWGPDAEASPAGRHLLDLSVRLLSRFYPAVKVAGPAGEVRDELEGLALAINPRVALAHRGAVDGGIVVGETAKRVDGAIFAGADDWTAAVGTAGPRPVGGSGLPFGPGVAAALAASNLFRMLLLPDPRLDKDSQVSALSLVGSGDGPPITDRVDDSALIGAGAIGNAAAWALARVAMRGELSIVDHESVELSNLQRYVLAERRDEGQTKVDLVARALTGGVAAIPFPHDLRAFAEHRNHRVPAMLLALDSAGDRRAAQASLPRWIANAWTQPNDLGVSVHPSFGRGGACVACLYLPDATVPNEDALVAEALGIPDQVAEVRTILYKGAGVPRQMLELIAGRLGVPLEVLAPYEERPIRQLYVEGICGGGVIPLGAAGIPRGELHVPLAHQSALAGVLLAAALVAPGAAGDPTTVAHLDPSRPVPSEPTQRARSRADGRCICEDSDYRATWARKYGSTAPVSR